MSIFDCQHLVWSVEKYALLSIVVCWIYPSILRPRQRPDLWQRQDLRVKLSPLVARQPHSWLIVNKSSSTSTDMCNMYIIRSPKSFMYQIQDSQHQGTFKFSDFSLICHWPNHFFSDHIRQKAKCLVIYLWKIQKDIPSECPVQTKEYECVCSAQNRYLTQYAGLMLAEPSGRK